MNLKFYKKIIQKNRLNDYKEILLQAQKEGYVITSLIDWYDKYKGSNTKVLVLRHDVDYDYKGAYDMYKLEKSLGVKSTYYFRWLSVNDRIMKEMHDSGFEVSLHYETLATYAKKNQITNKKDVTKDVLHHCFNLLGDELNDFEKRFWKIRTICSHGDKVNRILQTTNVEIIDYTRLIDYGIDFNTYNPEILKEFDAYISDSSIYNNFEWKKFGAPAKAFKQGKKSICLLTHPIHWNQNIVKNIQMLYTVYVDNTNIGF